MKYNISDENTPNGEKKREPRFYDKYASFEEEAVDSILSRYYIVDFLTGKRAVFN